MKRKPTADEPREHSAALHLSTSPTDDLAAPPWSTEAIVLLRTWWSRWLLLPLVETVRLERGRAGTFEAVDFVLVLLAYAASGAPTIERFYAEARPVVPVLASAWGRADLPSRSALSRALGAVEPGNVEAMRALFFDLLQHGARGPALGGLFDRMGRRHVVFDLDGTRQAHRQRAVTCDPARPAARRRTAKLAAPGYTGRKRGEVVRTRMALQQAHTREWLGTFGEAGNGERWPRFERAADHVVAYLCAHALSPGDGLLRLDGEFGCARTVVLLAKRGLGYVMRCHDYRLLDAPLVRQALATAPQRFVQTDTGTVRDVYDAGSVPWTSEVDAETVTTRLIVTATRVADTHEPSVGKRVGDLVYELFVTDRAPEALTAVDVLSLYFARGGFEQTLSEEDRELDPDRWFSGHPHGQELAQILTQWVWNTRLQLGQQVTSSAPRITLWSEALTPAEPERTTATTRPSPSADAAETMVKTPEEASAAPTLITVPVPETAQPTRAAPVAAQSTVKAPDESSATPTPITMPVPKAVDAPLTAASKPLSERDGFVLQPDGTLRCPEDKTLRRAEVRRDRVRFVARNGDCRPCPRATQCLGKGASGQRGRRVDWPAAGLLLPHAHDRATAEPTRVVPALQLPRPAPTLFSAPPRPGPEPLYWHDLAATSLRRLLPSMLWQQRIDGLPPPAASPPPHPPPILDRNRRAHRRLSWRDRLSRNAWPASMPVPRLLLHGIPSSLAVYLGAQTPR